MHDALIEELLDNAEMLLASEALPIPLPDRGRIDGRSRWGSALRAAFVTVNRLRSVPRRPAQAVAVVGLAGAAGLHALWAVGVDWPGTDRVDLARKVVGVDVFPSDFATWTVAGLLTVAAGVAALTGTRFDRASLSRLVTGAGTTVAAVLALRAIGGAISSAGRLLARRPAMFAARDILVYSPLCAILAIAVASSVVHRTTDPMSGSPTAP